VLDHLFGDSIMPAAPLSGGRASAVPRWDRHNFKVYWKGKLIKQFRGEAPHQEAVLDAFQACAWRPWVEVADIALEVDDWVNAKERLRNTVKNLNRTFRPHFRFRLERHGSRVAWFPVLHSDRVPGDKSQRFSRGHELA
jgi:hypothetical protein